MKIKSIILAFTLSFMNLSYATSRNLCDDLADTEGTTPEQIKKCQDKFGISDFYTAEFERKKIAEASKTSTTTADVKKVDNIETKTFSLNDLVEAGFGKPFYALTDDYRYGRFKQTRVTEGNSLCSYLGYEKAVKSVVSIQINQEDSNKKGLIIDKNFLGIVKAPELYKQDDPKVGVRKYVEITCVRAKDKKIDATEALKAVVENLVILDENLNAEPQSKTTQIFDKTGTKKLDSTPHGYKVPDWMKDGSEAVQK